MNIKSILAKYDTDKLTIATLGSHSALDICQGAKRLGFQTLVVSEKGREKVYSSYYKTKKSFGCVDECLVLDKFSDLLKKSVQKRLVDKNCLFVPHRSFEVYLNFDYQAIEKKFRVPVFGNRYLLKIEERGRNFNQYDLLEKAGIRYPRQFKNPKEIDRLSLVKVLEKERGFERAFFLVKNYQDYQKQVEKKIKEGAFTEKQLKDAAIEEFITGVQVNLNFFYSPLSKRLELLGTDTRRQTNLEGILKIPSSYQDEVLKKVEIKYEEAGHIAVTILESLLEQVYEIGEKFVKTCQKFFPPGIIGPFALQSFILPGPPQKEFVVVDVSPRVPGSPGIQATPYSSYLYGKSLSSGERLAMEISMAKRENKLERICT
jgi:5-formaminoimidazole-4-carboxamide-1-(beta)-D-ribofuranosyl 5'-monophosphate synthetase